MVRDHDSTIEMTTDQTVSMDHVKGSVLNEMRKETFKVQSNKCEYDHFGVCLYLMKIGLNFNPNMLCTTLKKLGRLK